jgi:hypothetical protein
VGRETSGIVVMEKKIFGNRSDALVQCSEKQELKAKYDIVAGWVAAASSRIFSA